MTPLDRNRVPVPSCLAAPEPGQKYARLTAAEKAEIRAALVEMQRHRCAYCERRTADGRDNGHIEHFRKQADNPALEVHWPNLFWSCIDEGSCGKHKDQCGRPGGGTPQARFDPADLIDPCVDDPDKFLLFLDDGSVQPRSGLSPADERRARETIRVFRLATSASLRKMREDAIRPYKRHINHMLSFGALELIKYIDSIRDDIESMPFSAAIRQYIRRLHR